MGIPNELSSDVAAAILARKDPQVQQGSLALIEIVRDFHSAMRDLKSEERRRRLYATLKAEPTEAGSRAASG